ncbi:uncharacterized protein PV09_06128 [Verruconis gallopava]|uniref:ABM domain-containing protein n=1 Tax=Verruconis gallopava TaxID=253628 RepID=A0A0D1XK33_9PEZI|nr:uncharacterized protein PV09_06128 [Verruconis gallopava]KIW02691.1 hypothetical protein PV09_06128 [Verruconis gallopava]
MVLSEIVRFVLPRSQSARSSFHDLRAKLDHAGVVKNQYFGYVLQKEGYPVPKQENLMCWYIEWPDRNRREWSPEMTKSLSSLAGGTPNTSLCEFVETKAGGIREALESNVCQFAVIKLGPSAPRSSPNLERSMHKTFTDCYLAEGFVNGGWGYVCTTNDADGTPLREEAEILEEKDRHLAFYVLGWDSLESHHAYSRTQLYDEEIDKLSPYFAQGTGAWYVTLRRHEPNPVS